MKTFSESWYRVANQRICLRPGVRVRRQNFRGERWIVLENPFSNQYFRLRPAAYEFVARLQPDRTVEQVWEQCLDRFPDEAPSQESVIQLLAQLYFANLLQYDLAADSAQLFQRYKERKQREIGFQFLNIMFMRFPLLDPDRFLVRILPVVGKLVSPAGALLWAIVVGFAVKIVVDNFGALRDQGQNVLAPGNLILLYLGLIFVKTIPRIRPRDFLPQRWRRSSRHGRDADDFHAHALCGRDVFVGLSRTIQTHARRWSGNDCGIIRGSARDFRVG